MDSGASVQPSRQVGFLLGVGILFAPLFFVWFLLRQGYSTFARMMGFGWLVVAVVLVASLGQSNRGPVRDPDTGKTVADSPSGGSLYEVTAAEYAQISTGMSYAQVAAIIGAPGEESSSSDLAGIKTEAFTWKNFDGSNALLMFQNDKLISKAQFGLK